MTVTEVLTVQNLTKNYSGFRLDRVSFSLERGTITGFIGRNGAGKTTTLKSVLGLLRRDGGQVLVFGKDPAVCRQEIGYVGGGFGFYPTKKLKTVTAVIRNAYQRWDESAYRGYLRQFALDENKTVSQLSAGMKVKYSLALALSHGASLLILDEPTSGLDPMSREELLDIFLELRDQGVTILFSTHLTSDLSRCADRILYLRQGTLVADVPLEEFSRQYLRVRFRSKPCDARLVGLRREKNGWSALAAREFSAEYPQAQGTDLETVITYLEREVSE